MPSRFPGDTPGTALLESSLFGEVEPLESADDSESCFFVVSPKKGIVWRGIKRTVSFQLNEISPGMQLFTGIFISMLLLQFSNCFIGHCNFVSLVGFIVE